MIRISHIKLQAAAAAAAEEVILWTGMIMQLKMMNGHQQKHRRKRRAESIENKMIMFFKKWKCSNFVIGLAAAWFFFAATVSPMAVTDSRPLVCDLAAAMVKERNKKHGISKFWCIYPRDFKVHSRRLPAPRKWMLCSANPATGASVRFNGYTITSAFLM